MTLDELKEAHKRYLLADDAHSCMVARDNLDACTSQMVGDLIASVEALRDMRAGWRYIRETHGDLYGVGWDRCEESATAALSRLGVE